MSTELVLLEGATPKGYADGRIGKGRVLHVAGQIGWNADHVFVAKDLVGQFAQTLDNVLAVLRVVHVHPSDVAEMTIYVTDIPAYRAARREIGAAWRARLGTFFPAMALVGVTELVEPEALVEIQCTAYLEHDE
jgi:enamine deaminase RidA (YjgF/YER057c/UK114 family)